jgi:hypothetical protein
MTSNISSLELAVAKSAAHSAINTSSFLCSSQESTPLNALIIRAVAVLADFEEWIPVTSTGMKSYLGIRRYRRNDR